MPSVKTSPAALLRLWVFGDASWTNRAIVEEVLRTVAPAVLLVSTPHEAQGAVFHALTVSDQLLAELHVEMSTEKLLPTWTPTTRPHLAIGFVNPGQDPASAGMAVRCDRAHLPLVTLFDHPAADVKILSEWVAPIPWGEQLASDLRALRDHLHGVWVAVPEEVRPDVAKVGTMVGAAIANPEWARVAEAWAEVERVLFAHPRFSLWLVNPGRILGGWARKLEYAG